MIIIFQSSISFAKRLLFVKWKELSIIESLELNFKARNFPINISANNKHISNHEQIVQFIFFVDDKSFVEKHLMKYM